MAEKTQGDKITKISATEANSKSGESQGAETINFDYIKSNQFRVIHADGAHGGVAPNGQFFQIAFFSERTPIPKREIYQIDTNKLGNKIKTEQRDAIIREVEVELLMSIGTAKSIHKWMGEKIKLLEGIQEETAKL